MWGFQPGFWLSVSPTHPISRYSSTELAECGWRIEVMTRSDCTTV
ncbi:hypothetical protein [Kovacikia minuta]|nr:hypothetical protein [Kovacikia minuta]